MMLLLWVGLGCICLLGVLAKAYTLTKAKKKDTLSGLTIFWAWGGMVFFIFSFDSTCEILGILLRGAGGLV